MIKNIFLKKQFQKRKAISPLIATILLVVVAVAIIGIVVSWGKGFTTSSLDQTTNVYKQADETIMLSFQSLDNGVLIFKNISTFDKDLEITGYKIFSENNHPLLNKMNNLQTPVTIKRNFSQKISIPVPVERKFNMELYTSDGYYIPLNNISTGKTPSLFSQTFGGLSDDVLEKPNSLLQTSDGGYLVLGRTYSFGAGSTDIYLLKTDVSGNLDWNKTFGGSSSDSTTQVLETSDGGYLVLGGTNSFGAGSSDIYLLKTDVSGNLDWNKTFGGSSSDYPTQVLETSDGGYLVLGQTYSFGAGGQDIYLLKTDVSGNLDWNKTFGGSSSEEPTQVIETSDGGYLVLGRTSSFGAGYHDIYLLKTDVSGNLDWNKTFGGSSWESTTQVLETSDGGYLVLGYTESFGAGGQDIYLLKTDFSGNSLKEKIIGGKSSDYIYSVAPSSEGGFLLGGLTFSFGGQVEDDCDAQILILKIDSQLNSDISSLIESLYWQDCEY